jgi:hypothetical protein
MTDAERQRRRRKRLRKEKKEAEKALTRQKNLEKYRASVAEAEWTRGIILPPETPQKWAACEITAALGGGYTDEEVLALLAQIEAIAIARRLIQSGRNDEPE